MKSRTAARELALLAFSQLSKNIDQWKDKDIEDIIAASVRTLVNESENNLKIAVGNLVEIKNFLEAYEVEHPENVKKPLDSPIVPVPIPMTSDMIANIDTLINVADKAYSALEISELSALSKTKEVHDYAVNVIKLFVENKNNIDEEISKAAKGWNIERLVKIDRNILRIAITELLYIEEIPISVTIDEAVELAKKYSTEESSSFINGILRQVVEENNLQQIKK